MQVITPLEQNSELELVAMMRQGNRHAFHEIYERHWLKLYRLARNRLRSADDAEDLVQDLFFSLWMKRDSLVIKSSLSAYLCTAIKYKVINHIELNVIRGNYINSLNNAVADYDNSTDETIIRRDLEQQIDRGMGYLSPKVKEVFTLSRKENLSINEIARKLNISNQTVKNQLSKALKILRVNITDISAIYLLFLLFSWR